MPYKVNEIIPMVKERLTTLEVVEKLRIMDDDLDFYNMKLFDTNSIEGTPLGSNFRSFTSNEPRTFADKIISLIVSGEIIINVPYMDSDQGERERFEKAERFWAGCFESADERLENALRQPLQVQVATQLALRGTCCARVLIRNNADDTSFVDIKPLDPRHSAWQASDEGLIWFCNISTRTVAQIRHEYPKAPLSQGDEEVMDVYDFYDEKFNTVLAEGTTASSGGVGMYTILKKRTEHGQEEVPVIVVPGGSYSALKAGPLDRTTIPAGYGESIYASVRNLYPLLNEVLSIYLELVAKSRDQTFTLYSDEETRIDENPNESSGVLHLAARDRLAPIEVPQTTRDASQLVGIIQGMIQRGTLPQTAFGELAFQLSGFAITQLRQSLFSTMEPDLRAMAIFYRKSSIALSDQIVSERVNPMELSGEDRNRKFFRQVFSAEDLKNIPHPRVKVVPQLPQDDAQRIQLAQALRQGKTPLLPDRIILDEILEMQDAGKIMQMVKEQIAEQGHPAAAAIVLAKTMLDLGREDLAAVYLQEVQKNLSPAPPPPGGPGLPSTPPPGLPTGLPPGLPPGVLPPQLAGLLQAAGAATQGPQVPPGSPRPGTLGA